MAIARGFAKSTRPHVARVHARERLFRRLDEASNARVVWVHGPPGSGKTVLVSSWIAQRSLPALWLQLDSTDADDATFFHSLGLAVQSAVPNAKLPVLSVEALAEVGAFSRMFFRALFAHRKAPSVLILDDYHVLPEDSRVHAQLAEGLQECPPGTQVVAISRNEPPAAWVRLRVRECLEVVHPEELVLSNEESAAIVALRTKRHDQDLSARLHGTSGGWAAGLTLLLEATNHGRTLNTDELVFDFLAEEVLARLDAESQSVLLACSLVQDFDEQLAIGLSGVARAGPILTKLARRGYFTVRLEHTGWYRFHPLFREFLRQRAIHQWGGRIRTIQAQAARLLFRAGRAEDALELASQAGAWDELEPLVLELAPRLLREGRARTVSRHINALPEDHVNKCPWLLYWRGIACRPFNSQAAFEALEQAYGAFVCENDASGIILSWSALVLSYLWISQPVPEIWVKRLEDAERAFTRANLPDLESSLAEAAMGMLLLRSPRDPALARWQSRALQLSLTSANDPARFAVGCQLHFTYAFWGLDLPRARLLQDALEPLSQSARIDPAGTILWLLSESHYHFHAATLDRSVDAARRALALAAETAYHYWDVLLHGIVAQAELARGELAAAKRAVADMLNAAAAPGTPLLMRSMQHFVCGMYALCEGNRRRAREEASSALCNADELAIPLGQAMAHVLLAFAVDEADQGPNLSDALRRSKKTGYRPGEFASGLGLALRALRAGDRDQAIATLTPALAIGHEYGFMNAMPFGDRDWSDVCAFAIESGIEQEYVVDIIKRRRIPACERARELQNWPWAVRVLAIDGFSVLGRGIQTRSRKGLKKPLEMLRLLVEAGPRGSSLEHLAARLWPDAEGDHAVQTFHTTLHRLRDYLDDAKSVLHSDGRFMLNGERVYVDTWAIEHLVNRVERLGREPDTQRRQPHECKRLRERIAELWDPVEHRSHALESASLRRLQPRLQRVLAASPR